MSRVHVLVGRGTADPRTFQIVIHDPVPAGQNAANILWSVALVNAGLARTQMPEGTGPGQITTAEKAQVESGAVAEYVFPYTVNGSPNPAQLVSRLSAEADKLVQEMQRDLADKLRYFGASA